MQPSRDQWNESQRLGRRASGGESGGGQPVGDVLSRTWPDRTGASSSAPSPPTRSVTREDIVVTFNVGPGVPWTGRTLADLQLDDRYGNDAVAVADASFPRQFERVAWHRTRRHDESQVQEKFVGARSTLGRPPQYGEAQDFRCPPCRSRGSPFVLLRDHLVATRRKR